MKTLGEFIFICIADYDSKSPSEPINYGYWEPNLLNMVAGRGGFSPLRQTACQPLIPSKGFPCRHSCAISIVWLLEDGLRQQFQRGCERILARQNQGLTMCASKMRPCWTSEWKDSSTRATKDTCTVCLAKTCLGAGKPPPGIPSLQLRDLARTACCCGTSTSPVHHNSSPGRGSQRSMAAGQKIGEYTRHELKQRSQRERHDMFISSLDQKCRISRLD